MQLDIFEDSREVMLRNDVVLALERRAASRARDAVDLLASELPGDPPLPALQLLTSALEADSDTAFATHAALRAARTHLEQAVEPAALETFGADFADEWVRPLWRRLAERALRLSFAAAHAEDHAAWLWLRAQDWRAARTSIGQVESWRRIPAPLAWMVEARLHLEGFAATLPLIVELAWLSAGRLREAMRRCREPLLVDLCGRFERDFEAPDGGDALAWFPAWLLTERPDMKPQIARAQAAEHSPPEQVTRLLVELIGLERQGRHHEVVARRKTLRELQPAMFDAYMKTR